MAELAINKDPALISDFDANYEDVSLVMFCLWDFPWQKEQEKEH